MTTCIILHNIIIEDEHNLNALIIDAIEAPTTDVEMTVDDNTWFEQFLTRHRRIKEKDAHIHQLQTTLHVANKWQRSVQEEFDIYLEIQAQLGSTGGLDER